MLSPGRTDDDLAARVPLSEVRERVGHLRQPVVPPVDRRPHPPRLEELAEVDQVVLVRLREEHRHVSAPERRSHSHRDEAPDREACETVALRAPDLDHRRLRLEHARELGPAAAARDVEQDVVAPVSPREVLSRVVDDVIRAERADRLDVLRAADARDLGSERLRDLHRVRPHASGGAVDEHLLPRPDVSLVADALERGQSGDAHCGRVLEGHVRGLVDDHPLLAHAHELGESTVPAAEDLVARSEPRHRLADLRHRARVIDAELGVLRPSQPVLQAHQIRPPEHGVPVEGVHGGRVHAHEHLVVLCDRPLDLLERERVGRSVLAAHDRPHPGVLRRRCHGYPVRSLLTL